MHKEVRGAQGVASVNSPSGWRSSDIRDLDRYRVVFVVPMVIAPAPAPAAVAYSQVYVYKLCLDACVEKSSQVVDSGGLGV